MRLVKGLYDRGLAAEQVRQLFRLIDWMVQLPAEFQEQFWDELHRFEEDMELDFSFGVKGIARFRGNVYNQRGAVGAAYRTIPYEIKGFADAGVPDPTRYR